MAQTVNPLGSRVAAIREEAQQRTASGIYLTDNSKDQSIVAKVVAIGPDSKLKIDDRIIYKEYSATQVKVDDVEYIIVNEDDILATV